MIIRYATLAAALLALAGCGVIYTVPSVHDGMPFATAYGTDYDVRVVQLSHETAAEANLQPYVPPRLPLAFQPEAVASMAEIDANFGALPPATARRTTRPAAISERLPAPLEAQPYQIGVADVLMLAIREPATLEELPGLISSQARRQGYVVQNDGAIAIPDAGRVRVAGLTLQEAEAAIFEALVDAGIDPAFSLEIVEFNSQRVPVGGLVGQPRLVPITLQPLRLEEALQLAGGIRTEDPETTTIQLFRDGNTYQITLERFLDDPRARNILLRDGDSVYVDTAYRRDEAQRYFQEQLTLRAERTAQLDRQRAELDRQRAELDQQRALFRERLELGAVEQPYAYLAGEVRQPSRFPLPFEGSANLADVLFEGGGMQIREADFGEIYVLRPASGAEEFGALTAYRLDAENAVNLGVATQFEMRPNDVVFIAEQPVTSWNRVISQILPQLFMSLTDRLANPV